MADSNDAECGFIPEAVVIEILARLPVKSLIRLKCVSKTWYNLISGKYFTRMYNELPLRKHMMLVQIIPTHPRTDPSLIILDDLTGLSQVPFNFVNGSLVRASSNGLLCCWEYYRDDGFYYICNPMTKEYRSLPRLAEGVSTLFHPKGRAKLVGLACNASTQKYTVVLAGCSPDSTFITMVFDSGTNEWKKLVTLQDEEFSHMTRNQAVFTNGALHWMTTSCSRLVVFDLNSESWRKIHLPTRVVAESGGSGVSALEWDGRLCVAEVSGVWMHVWVMEKYESEEWWLVESVSLQYIRDMEVADVFPVTLTDEYVFFATYTQVMVYERKTRVWKEMYVKNIVTMPMCISSLAFTTSFVSC